LKWQQQHEQLHSTGESLYHDFFWGGITGHNTEFYKKTSAFLGVGDVQFFWGEGSGDGLEGWQICQPRENLKFVDDCNTD